LQEKPLSKKKNARASAIYNQQQINEFFLAG